MAHLFTYAPFPSGVLGLAYIGSPRPFSVGGICSPRKITSAALYMCLHEWCFEMYSSLGGYVLKFDVGFVLIIVVHLFSVNVVVCI